MKCYDCGGYYFEHTGNIVLPSKTLGEFTLSDIKYLECAQCGEVFLPEKTWELADSEEERQTKKLISKLPIVDFIGATAAANILGMSRQALHKHKRIRRGFIYTYVLEGKIMYHKESLQLFKDTGDGRFQLTKQVNEENDKVILINLYSDNSLYQDNKHMHNKMNSRWKRAI